MKNRKSTGKLYYYAMGQRCRAKGISKEVGMAHYCMSAPPFSRIAFDKGYRGLAHD